jgi:cell wall-associated NlpC family hydrolase
VTFGDVLESGDRWLLLAVAGVIVTVALLLCLALVLPVTILAVARSGTSVHLQGAPQPAAQSQVVRSPHVDMPASRGSRPVDVARSYLGIPYVFGGVDPAVGLDCSGLVQLVFRQLGIPLPRTAQRQYNATARLTRDQLQPGDLVFFARTYADPHDWITHVGIYVGGGMQINAPTEGQVVSIQPVFSGFWGAHFAGGGRIAAG